MTVNELIRLADEARKRAYSPYSRFAVGAALLTGDGRVFCGCNIESASFSPTCCAERVAIFKAVSEGERNFSAIAVSGGEADGEPLPRCYPCGVCRQVLAEFCGEDMKIYFSDGTETTLGALLPFGFSLEKEKE
ncbi:MAG: cytidine deaminase [Clostridia bacterium]|nr:cytidine deaminase [Clostridia bacterium]